MTQRAGRRTVDTADDFIPTGRERLRSTRLPVTQSAQHVQTARLFGLTPTSLIRRFAKRQPDNKVL